MKRDSIRADIQHGMESVTYKFKMNTVTGNYWLINVGNMTLSSGI